MSQMNALLNQRLQKKENANQSKMKVMASQSANGQLTTFSGLFSPTEVSERERQLLKELIEHYANDDQQSTEHDLSQLLAITAEVKAIHHQAVLLHGERIKKARELLKNYREGAFSSWLVATYGNRQTPYNFLQYFEFYEVLAPSLQKRVLEMPRQAVYTLAARQGSQKDKEQVLIDYKGENKIELLLLIRERFPLDEQDKRRQSVAESFLRSIERAIRELNRRSQSLSAKERVRLGELARELNKLSQVNV